MANLRDLKVPSPPSSDDDDARPKASLRDAIAPEGVAPQAWQTEHPEVFSPKGPAIDDSPDLDRIVALPRRAPLDPDSPEAEAMVEYMMAKLARPRAPGTCRCAEIDRQIALGNRACLTRLLPVQAWALYEIAIADGLLASLPVGSGKTACNLLGLLSFSGTPTGLLLIPPSLVEQIILDYQLIAEHFRVPGIVVHMTGRRTWSRAAASGEPTLHVLPYSRLSQPESSDWLEGLRPSVIIADECDALRDRTAARTMRVMRYFSGSEGMSKEERQRRLDSTRFCGWTGSLTDSSILDYVHLSLLALRSGSPTPMDPLVAESWASCLDASPNPAPPGELFRLCLPGEEVRHAYRRRLRETMGFLITDSSKVVVSGGTQYIENDIFARSPPPLPAVVREALALVRAGERPNVLDGDSANDTFEDPMEQARCATEVATGMFYKTIFPRGEPEELIKRWRAARRSWNSESGEMMLRGLQHLDSPKLCEVAAQRAWGDLPGRDDRPIFRAESWPEWRDIRDLVQPRQKAVRLDRFLVEDAAQWAMSNCGIVWFGMSEFAAWLHELTRLPVHQGGAGAGERLRAENGDRSIISSIKSNGRGRDGLQHLYHHQLVANTPSSATAYEQLMGRLDRRGQKHAEVITEVYLHTPEVRKAFDQALRRANYVEATTGARHKILDGFDE